MNKKCVMIKSFLGYFSNYSAFSPSTSLLRSGRGSGCESATGLLELVRLCRQQPQGPALPVLPRGIPVNDAAGEAKGAAGAVVEGPNALIQPCQSVLGKRLPALGPSSMGMDTGQCGGASLVIFGVMSRLPPSSCWTPFSFALCFCARFRILVHTARREQPVKHLSNLGKMS